jgi:hypothetical protein
MTTKTLKRLNFEQCSASSEHFCFTSKKMSKKKISPAAGFRPREDYTHVQ